MVKKRLELERNHTSTLVVLALNEKPKYLRQLERELKLFKTKKKGKKVNNARSEVIDKTDIKKEPYDGIGKTALEKEFEDLTKKKVLNAKKRGNREIYYSINWSQICNRFLNHVEKLVKQRYDEDFYLIPSKYKDNFYLIELLKISFKANYEEFKRKKKKIRPMGLIFEELCYQLVYYLPPYEELIGNKELLKKKGMKEFGEFSEMIYDAIARDKVQGFDDFYTDYLTTKIYPEWKSFQKK